MRFKAPFILLNDQSEAIVGAICRCLSFIVARSNILKVNTVSGKVMICIVFQDLDFKTLK